MTKRETGAARFALSFVLRAILWGRFELCASAVMAPFFLGRGCVVAEQRTCVAGLTFKHGSAMLTNDLDTRMGNCCISICLYGKQRNEDKWHHVTVGFTCAY